MDPKHSIIKLALHIYLHYDKGNCQQKKVGAQWLSGKVLVLRDIGVAGSSFISVTELCVLEQDTLLSTGLTLGRPVPTQL